MKKLFTIFLIAIFGLLVVACTPSDNGDDNGGGNGDTDTTAPVFSGLDPATVDQGVAFDPREGVTATDDVDGDVTADIEIEGEVDVNTVGEYVLTYRVSDQAGNERVDDRRVEVVPMANLKNGDFSEGLAEWDQYHPTSIPVTFSAEDGEALIDIEELPGDNEWWNVQLQYNQLNLKAFFPYILEFTVRAENNRYMNHQIQGGGLPEKAYGEINLVEIGPEAVTVTKEFYVRGPGVNSQLQLSFGNFGPSFEQIPPELRVVAGKVWVSNVKITQGEPLENQPPVLNAPDIYVKPGARSLILSGVTVSDDRDFLDITDVQWTETTVDGEFNPENPEVGVYTFDLWVEDSEGLRTEVSRTIYVVEAFDLPTDWENIDEETDLPIGWTVFQADEGEYIIVDVEEGVVSVEINEIAPYDWQAMFRADGLAVYSGGTYTITFEARAEHARQLRIALEGAGVTNPFEHIELTTEWQTFTIIYEAHSDVFNRTFAFWFGSLTTERDEDLTFTAEDDVVTTVQFRNFAIDRN